VSGGFDTIAIRKNAEKFGAERFKKEFKDFIDGIMTEKP
jgi:hypothetical protein